MAAVAPAAACISCEYVPSVAHSPAPSHSTSHYEARRVYSVVKARRARAPKVNVVKTEPVAKKVQTAKKVESAKKVETAVAPIDASSSNENSTISTAAIAPIKTESENSTISTAASAKAEAKPVEEAKANANTNVGCKKFFASVGMTLTVPCE
jgi:hypothetical protein